MAEGRADQGVVACWTGTGASIAANKVPGVRAALCGDAETARGARRWNDANVLALSLRGTSEALLAEILDGWFEGEPSEDADDVANVRHLDDGVSLDGRDHRLSQAASAWGRRDHRRRAPRDSPEGRPAPAWP